MANVKDDTYYIRRIQQDLFFIVTHMQNVDEEALAHNEILQDSMMFRLIQISENARKMSDQYKAKNSFIPWTAIYGLRNRIVHDYGNVDLSIIFDTLKNSIPELLTLINEVPL